MNLFLGGLTAGSWKHVGLWTETFLVRYPTANLWTFRSVTSNVFLKSQKHPVSIDPQ